MSFQTKKSAKPRAAKEPALEIRETEEERMSVTIEYASLKDMPLEERRKEAKKPLYLTRYE